MGILEHTKSLISKYATYYPGNSALFTGMVIFTSMEFIWITVLYSDYDSYMINLHLIWKYLNETLECRKPLTITFEHRLLSRSHFKEFIFYCLKYYEFIKSAKFSLQWLDSDVIYILPLLYCIGIVLDYPC